MRAFDTELELRHDSIGRLLGMLYLCSDGARRWTSIARLQSGPETGQHTFQRTAFPEAIFSILTRCRQDRHVAAPLRNNNSPAAAKSAPDRWGPLEHVLAQERPVPNLQIRAAIRQAAARFVSEVCVDDLGLSYAIESTSADAQTYMLFHVDKPVLRVTIQTERVAPFEPLASARRRLNLLPYQPLAESAPLCDPETIQGSASRCSEEIGP